MECFEKTMILLIHTSYLRDVASISVEKNVVSKRTKDIHEEHAFVLDMPIIPTRVHGCVVFCSHYRFRTPRSEPCYIYIYITSII